MRIRLSADVCSFTLSGQHGYFRKNTCFECQNGSASLRNLYEWNTFSDVFPAKSNHISSCKFIGTASTFFRKCPVADSQIPAVPIKSRIFLFYAQKAYSVINYLLPSYPINHTGIFLFLLLTKSVFQHDFPFTTQPVPLLGHRKNDYLLLKFIHNEKD